MEKLGLNFSAIKVDEISFDSSLLHKQGEYIYNEFNEQLLFNDNEYYLVTNNPNDFLKNPKSKWSTERFDAMEKYLKEKFYVPKLEEFHVGFEYEYYTDQDGWIKKIYELKDFIVWGCDGNDIEIPKFRVKYLDKEDIDSLGWVDRGANRVGTYFNGQYFLFRDPLNEHRIFIQLIPENDSDVKNLFTGIIKNKSELKVIMKQIGIS